MSNRNPSGTIGCSNPHPFHDVSDLVETLAGRLASFLRRRLQLVSGELSSLPFHSKVFAPTIPSSINKTSYIVPPTRLLKAGANTSPVYEGKRSGCNTSACEVPYTNQIRMFRCRRWLCLQDFCNAIANSNPNPNSRAGWIGSDGPLSAAVALGYRGFFRCCEGFSGPVDQDFYPCPTPTGASDLCFQLNLGAYQLFLANLRPDPNSSTTFSCQSVDGGTNLPNASLASAENDDTQYTVGLASGVPTTCVSVGPNSAHYITYLAAMDQLPRVLAASY
ncbi:hypothetical protein JAAARDRAFT_199771, partial [Jaapia argillacea MUCL 33604]